MSRSGIQKTLTVLSKLQYSNGLFAAAAKTVGTGYDKAWIRDNVYATFGFDAREQSEVTVKTLRALLDILKKHAYKIDWMIKQPHQKHAYRYIHARYNPQTGEEFWDAWGNKQNDAVGALLFKIGMLHKKGMLVLRDNDDKMMVQKLVNYLQAIEYWHDADNGMWEEYEEVHASSIGACIAGLQAVQFIIDVPQNLIQNGVDALNKLLPRESVTKDVDLALLSLIYPYNIVDENQKLHILDRVEMLLVREKGVIRYLGDKYYGNAAGEAAWTMGFPWLAIIFKQMKNNKKYKEYLQKALNAMNSDGELPELYYAGTATHNENTPLAWAMSLLSVAQS